MILVTGGAGYIGSHTLIEILESDTDVIVLDNLCNGSLEALKRVEKLTNKEITFIEGDIRCNDTLNNLFSSYQVSSVMHFAGLKSVGESVENPSLYYDNNIIGSLCLFEAMKKANVFNIVFSSSATVYGEPKEIPISENCQTSTPTNPYGKSKLFVEEILQDYCASDSRWSVALLRYFNPIGAHVSGLIGEDPKSIPNNLLPYISQVAIGHLEKLSIFGNNYPTRDGTGIRDYIHVVDLAKGHVSALNFLKKNNGAFIWNLGTGVGYSVLEILKTFEEESNRSIPFVVKKRRSGDIAESWSDPSKARKELGWEAKFDLKKMISDTWRWQSFNPNGYNDM